jgi:AmmeMemoRadiSam system protein A
MSKEFSLSDSEKKFCASLARKSIEYYIKNGELLELSEKEINGKSFLKKLLEEKACFVTLMEGGELRGCIGHLVKMKPLYLDIIENAVNAAFEDPRFPPLSREELLKIKIEVSVLTEPAPLEYSSPEDLLKKLRAGTDGLIIRKGYASATFLPSVWEELPKKEEFLAHLCLKAGLSSDAWKEKGLKVERYEAIKAEEE